MKATFSFKRRLRISSLEKGYDGQENLYCYRKLCVFVEEEKQWESSETSLFTTFAAGSVHLLKQY